MQKSVYSIVLSDDVVSCVDRLAYSKGTSRSNMINQILAEYVSYVTPEKRLNDIFSRAAEMIDAMDQLQVMLGPSDKTLSIKSALRYKYNPTVRYCVELFKNDKDLGELRATLRTQSAGLINMMNSFYTLWDRVERSCDDNFESSLSEGKYTRRLRMPQTDSGEDVAEAIVDYVQALDTAMKGFFADVNNGIDPRQRVLATYNKYRNNSTLLL